MALIHVSKKEEKMFVSTLKDLAKLGCNIVMHSSYIEHISDLKSVAEIMMKSSDKSTLTIKKPESLYQSDLNTIAKIMKDRLVLELD